MIEAFNKLAMNLAIDGQVLMIVTPALISIVGLIWLVKASYGSK
mgnify:CR=1 FL=1